MAARGYWQRLMIPQRRKQEPPARPEPVDQRLIAIHTHLILCAARDVKMASDKVREAYANAERAGIPEKVLRRAMQMMAPGQKRLNEPAAALVQQAEAGAAEAGLRPGALLRMDGRPHPYRTSSEPAEHPTS